MGPMGYRPRSDVVQLASMLDLSGHAGILYRDDGSPWVRTVHRASSSYSSHDLRAWELGERVAKCTDTLDDIDVRMARAVPTDVAFADFIGA